MTLTCDEVLDKVEAGEFVPQTSDTGLVRAFISQDREYRKINIYCVRIDYTDEKTDEVTYTVHLRYRFFDDAYAIWRKAVIDDLSPIGYQEFKRVDMGAAA